MKIRDENKIMFYIERYSELCERAASMIEKLLNNGYDRKSVEVMKLQTKLHDLEVKSDFWRRRMWRFL